EHPLVAVEGVERRHVRRVEWYHRARLRQVRRARALHHHAAAQRVLVAATQQRR
ncbi:jg24067, partial [Pararge aegeria aegeria]